jgi:2-oxoglutarate dehydrogenase E2 component (dihydrolipoamide succinyltransferase)
MADEVQEITMPKLGESVTEGTVSRWLKEIGEPVAFDDPLFEVSTDKVDSEIPSPYDGVLLQILVQPGETVPVGTPLARVGPAGAEVEGEHSPIDESVAPPAPITAPASAAPAAPASAPGSPAEVHELTMPKLGESVTEGTVSRWLKQVGEPVAFDDPLFEVSTDKVDSEIPSPYDGVLLEVLVAEGETVPVGTPLARIGAEGASTGTASAATASAGTAAAVAAAKQAVAVPGSSPGGDGNGGGGGGRPLSPVVRRLAAEHNLDLSRLAGSGAGGRIMREDVMAALSAGTAPTASAAAPQAQRTTTAAAAAGAPAATRAPAATGAAPVAGEREEVVPLSRIRLVTAERMVESKRTSPHVWTSIEVDLERIEQLRQKHKAAFRKAEGASLTYLPFMARAICDALRAYPALNSSIDLASKTLKLHHYVNLAIAVDVNEQGLMAPVIKDAGTLNLRGMARAIKAVGDGAKNKTLKASDLSGSTFTISNPGPLGTYASAAIINQPNTGIITTEGVLRRPTAVGDAIAIHHMCILGLSYDHRAFDGVVAARFLAYIRDALQDRDWEAELV